MSKLGGWIGVDLDGTLAHYDHWRGPTHIGEPIPPMVARVKAWLKAGIEVRIFTARVSTDHTEARDAEAALARQAIFEWSLQHIGTLLPSTSEKDYGMIELWDDRAIRVEKNTGRILTHTNETEP